MMNNPEKFLQTLKDFKQVIDECRVPEQNFRAVEPLLALPHFNREAIQKKSTAAAGLAEWVLNIYQFYKVVESVAPKRRALEEATQQLEEANAKLSVVQKLVAELEEKVRDSLRRRRGWVEQGEGQNTGRRKKTRRRGRGRDCRVSAPGSKTCGIPLCLSARGKEKVLRVE